MDCGIDASEQRLANTGNEITNSRLNSGGYLS